MQELDKLLKEIADTTTVKLSVYSPSDKLLVGEDVKHTLPYADEKIYSDGANGVTVFKFIYSQAELYGVVGFSGEEGKNYAAMLTRIIESAQARSSRVSKQEYLKNILFGNVSADQISAFKEKYSLPESGCYVIAVNCEKHIREVENLMTQAEITRGDSAAHIDEANCAFIKFLSEDGEYQSASEYCDFIAQSVFEELGVHPVIGVGAAVSRFDEVALSYAQASTAVRMCKKFSSKGDVHTYKEYILIKMLEDIPENRKKEYMDELLDEKAREIFSDDELIGVAEALLSNSLNVSETSRSLYMHRNTLMYRLDKIEKATGLDIRKFSDAISFRMLTIMYRLLK